MLLEYFEKNNIALTNAINYKDSRWRYSALDQLLRRDHLNKEWLLLLFKICNQCKTNFTKQIIDKAIDYIDNNQDENDKFKDGKYKLIIENEYNKLNKLLNQ